MTEQTKRIIYKIGEGLFEMIFEEFEGKLSIRVVPLVQYLLDKKRAIELAKAILKAFEEEND